MQTTRPVSYTHLKYIETHEIAAILLDMGLGKTAITLTALYDLLFDYFEITRVLVIAPLRVCLLYTSRWV